MMGTDFTIITAPESVMGLEYAEVSISLSVTQCLCLIAELVELADINVL
jgi:hypothetical protein